LVPAHLDRTLMGIIIATAILPSLSSVSGKPLTATFDAGRLSSDGGVIVLREIVEDDYGGRMGLARISTPIVPGTSYAWRPTRGPADRRAAADVCRRGRIWDQGCSDRQQPELA